jgi:hypothetical protein
MDESIKCECGNIKFWYFGSYVRCPKCLNEMKQTNTGREFEINYETWIRRWNNEQHIYSNWEHFEEI